MRGMMWLGAAVAASMLGAAPAIAKKKRPVPVAPPAAEPLSADPVVRYYQGRSNAPIWLRDAQAPATLAAVLRRAPLDGLVQGPQLASEVEAAVARASGGDAALVRQAERLMSNAWVSYVAAIEAPVPGILYGDPAVRPAQRRPEQILHKLATAPSMVAHLKTVSDVNPTYAALRAAAVSEAQLPGGGLSAKIAANLERARALPASGRFVVVDVPSATLWMYENGQRVDSMKVVVGKREYPTPMIASVMHFATFNPYWHVPDHLVRNMAPGIIKAGPASLKARGYDVIAEWSGDAAVIPAKDVDWKAVAAGTTMVKVRQLPGGTNSMGKVKFPFPNNEGIYLHDTPKPEYFAKAKRDLSNGCIRVEDASRLARWLFGHEPAALTSKAPEQHVNLGRGVPIYVTYLTVHPQDGKLTVLDDIYGLDSLGGARSAAIR